MDTKSVSPTQKAVGTALPAAMVSAPTLDDRARAVSRSWMGQTQMEFRALVKTWEGSFPDLAKRLVGQRDLPLQAPYAGLESTKISILDGTDGSSDEAKLAIISVLKSMKSYGLATKALDLLSESPSLIEELDRFAPRSDGSIPQRPKHNLVQKEDMVRKMLLGVDVRL